LHGHLSIVQNKALEEVIIYKKLLPNYFRKKEEEKLSNRRHRGR